MDGLIHISELSWSHVNHPSEVLEIGQKVQVKVLDIDRDRQRISLGLKQTQADPWQQVLESYNEGDIVSGKVTKVVTFGAFVEILPGVEGLVHICELAQHHVENPREVVSQGDTVNVRILEVDAERRRLSLSLKRVDEGMPPQPGVGDEAAPPTIDLSEDVFSDSAPAAPSNEVSDDDDVEGDALDESDDEPDEEPGSTTSCPASPPRARTTPRPSSVKRPRAVALTGGIAAGKSEALKAFARHGAATASADALVHELLAHDAEVREAIRERWGDDAVGDRARIGAIVFDDRGELDWLEQLLHPRVAPCPAGLARGRRRGDRSRRDPAALRDRRREPLRRGRRRSPRRPRCARPAAAPSPSASRASSRTRRSCSVPTSPT